MENLARDVVILGAGLAGLGCAQALGRGRIFEAKSHPGGHAYSHPQYAPHEGVQFAFDEGAHICHSKDAKFLELISRDNDVVHMNESRVANRYYGQWLTYPVQNHLHELAVAERKQALWDVVSAHIQADVSVPQNYDEWCRKQYGPFLTEKFYQLYTSKYWRVPMAELATDWLGGRLLPAQVQRIVFGALAPQVEDQTTFARFYYPKQNGFFGFFSKLYQGLDITYNEPAVELDCERKCVSFVSGHKEHFEFLASSVALPHLVDMTLNAPAHVRDAAALLRHTSLLCVNIVVNRPALTDLHWFYIYDQDIAASRISVPSNLSQIDAALPYTVLQAEIFRLPHEPFEPTLLDRTISDLAMILGFSKQEVVFADTVKVPLGYVISDHARPAAVDTILSWFNNRGVYPMGLFGKWKFIWSDAAWLDGVATAQKILADANRK